MLDLSALDVAAVMFDCAEPASFEHAVQLLVGLSSNAGPSLPLLLVAAKDDLGMSSVRAECARILCACLMICNACLIDRQGHVCCMCLCKIRAWNMWLRTHMTHSNACHCAAVLYHPPQALEMRVRQACQELCLPLPLPVSVLLGNLGHQQQQQQQQPGSMAQAAAATAAAAAVSPQKASLQQQAGQAISSTNGGSGNVYFSLLLAALHPEGHVPDTPMRKVCCADV
jgi:hypothetical protein